jgi:hypothetical protein
MDTVAPLFQPIEVFCTPALEGTPLCPFAVPVSHSFAGKAHTTELRFCYEVAEDVNLGVAVTTAPDHQSLGYEAALDTGSEPGCSSGWFLSMEVPQVLPRVKAAPASGCQWSCLVTSSAVG